MVKLKQIKILSLAKLQGIVMGFVGLILGLLYGVGGAIFDAFTNSINEGTALALLAIIVMPILFGSIGFAIGAIEGYLYNLISTMFRGIKIEF